MTNQERESDHDVPAENEAPCTHGSFEERGGCRIRTTRLDCLCEYRLKVGRRLAMMKQAVPGEELFV